MKNITILLILTGIILSVAIFGKYTEGVLRQKATTIYEDRLVPQPYLSRRFDHYGTVVQEAFTKQYLDRDFIISKEKEILEDRRLTDGLYGYIYTPGYLEFLILDCLYRSKTVREFSDLLLKETSSLASDDVSFAIAFLGFGADLEKVRNMFRQRYANLKHLYQSFSDNPSIEDAESLIDTIWKTEQMSFNWYLGEKL